MQLVVGAHVPVTLAGGWQQQSPPVVQSKLIVQLPSVPDDEDVVGMHMVGHMVVQIEPVVSGQQHELQTGRPTPHIGPVTQTPMPLHRPPLHGVPCEAGNLAHIVPMHMAIMHSGAVHVPQPPLLDEDAAAEDAPPPTPPAEDEDAAAEDALPPPTPPAEDDDDDWMHCPEGGHDDAAKQIPSVLPMKAQQHSPVTGHSSGIVHVGWQVPAPSHWQIAPLHWPPVHGMPARSKLS